MAPKGTPKRSYAGRPFSCFLRRSLFLMLFDAFFMDFRWIFDGFLMTFGMIFVGFRDFRDGLCQAVSFLFVPVIFLSHCECAYLESTQVFMRRLLPRLHALLTTTIARACMLLIGRHVCSGWNGAAGWSSTSCAIFLRQKLEMQSRQGASSDA